MDFLNPQGTTFHTAPKYLLCKKYSHNILHTQGKEVVAMTTIFMKMLSNDMWNYSTYIFQISYYGCAGEKEEILPQELFLCL